MSNIIDEMNLRTMRSGAVVDFYADFSGLLLQERAALRQVTEEARGKPILDLGVGGGRTVKPLLKVSQDYLGIDYSPEMVEACRRRFPSQRFELGDARDLQMVRDESIYLVSFGWNGICMVSHEDRLKILREIHRVLMPGGVFILTTYNKDCPIESEGFRFPEFEQAKTVGQYARNVLQYGTSTIVRMRNWVRYRKFNQRLAEYSIINDPSHDYGVMLYYITLENQRRQLESLGYEADAPAYCVNGKLITGAYDGRDYAMLARKAARAIQ